LERRWSDNFRSKIRRVGLWILERLGGGALELQFVESKQLYPLHVMRYILA
jgi:hypothetical protein